MKVIVKRAGHSEPYDRRKLYASIYAACLVLREPIATAEMTAAQAETYVEAWLERKHEVTSNDIRRVAAKHLKSLNPEVAFQYLHHRVVW